VTLGRRAPWSAAAGVVHRRASGVGPVAVLPGDALIELELRCGLRQRVPLRHRQIIPGGRSAGRGDPWGRGWLAELRQNTLNGF
jgi:hypothetical protein